MIKFRWLLLVFGIWFLMAFTPTHGASSLDVLLQKNIPQGWLLGEGPHVYNRKTLFEHIDGQAELFLKYGFRQSAFGIYEEKGNPRNQVEVDIYDMGSVLQAFGVFSRFRGEHRPFGIGLESYSDDRSALFYQGRYFVMLYAAEPDSSILKEFSSRICAQIQDSSTPPKELGYFPDKGLRPGSIQYFPEGLLGHQFLKKGFLGSYTEEIRDEKENGRVKDEEGKFQLFLAIFEGPESSRRAFKAYTQELSKKGRIALLQTDGFKGEDPYRGLIMVARKGRYLFGAIGFEREKNGKELLGELIKRARS